MSLTQYLLDTLLSLLRSFRQNVLLLVETKVLSGRWSWQRLSVSGHVDVVEETSGWCSNWASEFGRKGISVTFGRGLVVGARIWLGFSCTTTSRLYREWSISSELHAWRRIPCFCQEPEEDGQFGDDRKATGTKMTTKLCRAASLSTSDPDVVHIPTNHVSYWTATPPVNSWDTPSHAII